MILCRLIKAFLVYCFALFGSSKQTMQARWTILLCSYWNQGHPAIFFANWSITFEGWNNRFLTKYKLLDGEGQANWKQYFFLSRRKTLQYIFARTSTVMVNKEWHFPISRSINWKFSSRLSRHNEFCFVVSVGDAWPRKSYWLDAPWQG